MTTTPTVWRKMTHVEVTQEILDGIVERIVSAFHPHKIILFGSYAKGNAREDSDIDLLVIMDSDERPARRNMRVSEIAHVPFLPMDILVRTPDEIKQRLEINDFFIIEILESGRVLYEQNAR